MKNHAAQIHTENQCKIVQHGFRQNFVGKAVPKIYAKVYKKQMHRSAPANFSF